MFRKLALGAAVALATAGMAVSDPAKGPIYNVPPAAALNWNGGYFGVSGGWGLGSTRWSNPAISTGDFDTDGFLVGAAFGHNWQRPDSHIVVGVEADISWADISGSTSNACNPLCESTLNLLITLRGRAGVTNGTWLFYATGGVALANFNYSIGDVHRLQTGWTVGGGIEAALNRNWSWKAEYLLVSFGRNEILGDLSADFSDNHIIRLGLNHRF